MKIDELILEVTRKCNMKCRHCLRGKQEDIDADVSLLPNIFNEIKKINCITFTGGEPSLNSPYILSVLDYCKRYQIHVNEIYIATNGLMNLDLLMDSMEQWLKYCMKNTGYKDREDYLNHHQFRVACSLDEFHDSIDLKSYNFIRSFGYYDDSKEVSYKEYQCLITAGNVLMNGLDENEDYVTGISGEKLLEFEYGKDKSVTTVYVSSNGYVYSGCNFSYEDFDEETWEKNNLREYTLREICKNNFNRINDMEKEWLNTT